MWCPVNIRDYEQRSRYRANVCTCVYKREFECDFLLLELLASVAPRNTTTTFGHLVT